MSLGLELTRKRHDKHEYYCPVRSLVRHHLLLPLRSEMQIGGQESRAIFKNWGSRKGAPLTCELI